MRRTPPCLFCLFAQALAIAACEAPTQPPSDTEALQQPSLAVVWGAPWGAAASVDLGGLRGVNTAANEGCPIESPDGRSLFFASNRAGQLDIWVATRESSGDWGAPVRLPEPINSGANEFCPTPLPGGGLLFVSTRNDGLNCGNGTSDFYETRLQPDGGWADPEHLGCTVNSAGNEFSPSYLDLAGGSLYFSSDVSGKHRVYVAARERDDWHTPVEVSELNRDGYNTARPNVSADGRAIVFDSNRSGGLGSFDIWYSYRESPSAPWSDPVNLGQGINSAASESRATLSRDGRRLYFGSTRAGFQGNSDLFVSKRR